MSTRKRTDHGAPVLTLHQGGSRDISLEGNALADDELAVLYEVYEGLLKIRDRIAQLEDEIRAMRLRNR